MQVAVVFEVPPHPVNVRMVLDALKSFPVDSASTFDSLGVNEVITVADEMVALTIVDFADFLGSVAVPLPVFSRA